jgi:hypothetical protein
MFGCRLALVNAKALYGTVSDVVQVIWKRNAILAVNTYYKHTVLHRSSGPPSVDPSRQPLATVCLPQLQTCLLHTISEGAP